LPVFAISACINAFAMPWGDSQATRAPQAAWSFRAETSFTACAWGDYRIVYQIQGAILIVLVVQIGHRREIYRQ
jgi:hypothetical protein